MAGVVLIASAGYSGFLIVLLIFGFYSLILAASRGGRYDLDHRQQIKTPFVGEARGRRLELLSQVALDFRSELTHNRGVRVTVDGREEATFPARIPEGVPRRGELRSLSLREALA